MEMPQFENILAALGITPQQVAEALRKMPPGFQDNFKFFAVVPMGYVPEELTDLVGNARLPVIGYKLILFQDTAACSKEVIVMPGGTGHYPVVKIDDFLEQTAA